MRVKDRSRSEGKIFILQFQRLFAARCSGKPLVDAISSVSAYSTQWKDICFPLPWTPVQPYPQGEPHHNPSMHSVACSLVLHHSWQFALQSIALRGQKVQVLPWMCIKNKRSRIHRGFLKLNQVYTLQHVTVLAILKCWVLARILLPSMSGQWDQFPTSVGH